MVFITSYVSGNKKTLIIPKYESKNINGHEIYNFLCKKEGCHEGITLTCEGKLVYCNDEFCGDTNIIATLKLCGGKGGFGSMLRAIGAQIEKTTNREACRDLSGRRLRDINEEKRLKEYLAKKVDKEKVMFEQKKKKLERMKEDQKHIFEDKEYFAQREKRENDLHDSIDKAFATSSGSSSSNDKPKEKQKEANLQAKPKRWMMDDLDESSGSEESDNEEKPVVADKAAKRPETPDEDEELHKRKKIKV